MNIYYIEQSENNGYDTYDSAVVAAESEDAARLFHPNGDLYEENPEREFDRWDYQYGSWASHPSKVSVELIGVAKDGQEAGVILASFNAG